MFGLSAGLPRGLHLSRPAPFHRQAAEHAGFARADRRRAEGIGGVGAVAEQQPRHSKLNAPAATTPFIQTQCTCCKNIQCNCNKKLNATAARTCPPKFNAPAATTRFSKLDATAARTLHPNSMHLLQQLRSPNSMQLLQERSTQLLQQKTQCNCCNNKVDTGGRQILRASVGRGEAARGLRGEGAFLLPGLACQSYPYDSSLQATRKSDAHPVPHKPLDIPFFCGIILKLSLPTITSECSCRKKQASCHAKVAPRNSSDFDHPWSSGFHTTSKNSFL